MATKKIKAYKVFNSDWTCRGFQYEVGKRYAHKGEVTPCYSGFHACPVPVDCFNYYSFNPDNKVAEVTLSGNIVEDGDKLAASVIKIEREIEWTELLGLVNTGKGNTGHRNSGHSNSGDSNSGHSNSGDSNSGHSNSGHRNSGDSNSGHSNSGHSNSGYYNSGSYHTGCFNTDQAPMRMFNGKAEVARKELSQHPGWMALESEPFILTEWIDDVLRAEGGYLKTHTYHEAWANRWAKYSDKKKQLIQTIPGFCPDIFRKITGIDVTK